MREVIIIEKEELMGLSVLIAKSIIDYSQKDYGFRMVSRDNRHELRPEGMLGTLAPAIRKGLEEGLKREIIGVR